MKGEHRAHLRQPFPPQAVKWRADAKEPDRAGFVRCVIYIDSRLAEERLGEVDPAWTADYTFLAAGVGDAIGVNAYCPVRCDLTVLGVTRSGFGQNGTKTADGKYVKSAVSDAIKRAAVEFGVGAYLYAMPVFKVAKGGYWLKGDGKVGGLNPEGVKQLRKQYTTVVQHEKFQEQFGEPIEYGVLVDDERSATPEGADDTLPGLETPERAAGVPVQRGKARARA